jgi:CHAT domain-containing protein
MEGAEVWKSKDSRKCQFNLKYADNDAQDFYDILTQGKEGFFKAGCIEKLINEEASQRGINRALKRFLKLPGKDDIVLIYFACHGTYDPDRPQNSYILPYDTDPDDIASTSVPMREIELSIRENLNAKKSSNNCRCLS